MDITPLYWDLVIAAGRAHGIGDDGLKKLRSAQLLRSLGSKNTFTKAATEVAHNVASLRTFLLENQQRYAQPGRLKESERDEIEAEVATYVRACSANISKLQEMLRVVPTSSPAKAVPASPDIIAHRQGLVLILSERLGALTSAFDRLRGLRYKRLQQEEANKRRRTPTGSGSTAVPRTSNGGSHGGMGRMIGSQLRAAFDVAAGGSNGNMATTTTQPPPQHPQQQAVVDAENVALQAELLSMGDSVQHTERTVREIATLNQIFSTAILHQSAQIEQLYTEAVAATGNISKANVQLEKTVKTKKSAQKWLFILLLLASVSLLFLDWWYS